MNLTRWRNSVVDEALDEIRATDDPETQRDHWADVQRELLEDRPFLFLVHLTPAVGGATSVHGLGEWNLPGGEPGLRLGGGAANLSQVWIS